MLTIYKSVEGGLDQMDAVVPGCWINLVDPTAEEIEQVMALGVPQDFITYPLDIDERSRTEREDDGKLLVLLRIPYFHGAKADIPYNTIPLGIIMADQYLVTVCRRENEVLGEIASGRLKGISTAKRNRFILRTLLQTASKYLSYLREINKIVDALEDQLQLSMRNNEVMELLKYQKSLVYFTTALKSNELMMERLQRSQLFRMYPDDEDLLEDVLTENQQAIEMVNISNNILSSMMDAFASIISNNLNVVMKFLASVTIVMSIPSVITGFFGMNVNLPIADHPYAYVMIIGVSLLASVGVVAIFQKRHWF
jgi:magnesium transporter